MPVYLAVLVPVIITIAFAMAWGIRRTYTTSAIDLTDVQTRGFVIAVTIAVVVFGAFAFFRNPAIRMPVGIVVICALSAIVVGTIRHRQVVKRLTGTGQILSVETMTHTEGANPRYLWRIGLSVEIPGRPPYDATCSSGQFTSPVEIAAIQPGRTVAVQVDSANPQNVRIDFTQPIT